VSEPFLLCEELDIATVAKVEADLRMYATRCDGDEVVVDCRDCTFVASTGLSMLLRVAEDVAPRRLVLCNLQPAPLRLLELTTLTDFFSVDPRQDA
jgi:anti-anti-sigma factor